MAEALATAVQAVFQQALDLAAVEQAGQRVMGGQAFQALFEGAAFAEVDQNALDAVLAGVLVQRQQHPVLQAIQAAQRAFATGGAAVVQLGLQLLPVQGADQLGQTAVDQQADLILGNAAQTAEAWVVFQQATFAGAAEDALGGTAEQVLVALQVDDSLLLAGDQRLAQLVELLSVEHAEQQHVDQWQAGMQRIEHIAARDYSGSAERQEDHQQDRGGPEQGKPGGEGAAQAQAEYGQTNLVQADSEKQQIDHLRWPGVFKVADQPGLHQQQGEEQAIAQPAQRTLLQVETAGDEQTAEDQRQAAAEVGFNRRY